MGKVRNALRGPTQAGEQNAKGAAAVMTVAPIASVAGLAQR
jgi:hypothetical protein